MDKQVSNLVESGVTTSTKKDQVDDETGAPNVDTQLPAQGSRASNDATHTNQHHRHSHSPRRHSHSRRADNLDEATLQRVKEYLEAGLTVGVLDENAVGNRMARTARAAQDEVRYRLDLAEDSEDERERILETVYVMFEEQSIAQEVYKKVASDTQRQSPSALDKRTMTWIRKAIGLHKRTDFWEPCHHHRQGHYHLGRLDIAGDNHESGDSDDENGKPRRLTRGMARSSRIAKSREREEKESMGLNALVSAVEELEEEMGPLPTRLGRRKAKRKKTDSPEDTEKPSSKKVVALSSRAPIALKGKEKQPGIPKHPGKSKKRLIPPAMSPAQPSTRRKRKQQQVDEEEEDMSGFLLGPIDPASIYKNLDDARAVHSLSAPVSLNLLEWRRRQQWTPASKNLPEIDVPSAFALSQIEVGLPSWSAANPIPHVQRKPSTKEPPRRRHSDSIYASWSTKVINCLKGSGRSWAHHEFFYSDLDRAWFSFNEFKAEVAKLGIPPHSKLTRREWSLVRRCIPNRPRRFSRRFVQKQLDQLSAYRHTARWVQKVRRGRPPYFRYEVPAAIKVGSTVSAYNSRYRIIHRGTVLSHDEERHGYVIMFERKELGFAFCPDIDVASHGVPDILFHAAETSLNHISVISDLHSEPGSLPYGTSYGPVYGPEEEGHSTKSLLSRLTVRDRNLLPGQNIDSESSGVTRVPPAMINGMDPAVVEQVAERETIVRLVGVITGAMQRKARLLDAIESFLCTQDLDKVRGNAMKVLRSHYAWLQANLQMTNQSLESALTYLQVMYSNGYAGILSSLTDSVCSSEPVVDEELLALNEPNSLDLKFTPTWSSQISGASGRLAEAAVKSQVTWDVDSSLDKADKQRRDFFDQQLGTACSLILSLEYCSSLLLGDDAKKELVPSARTLGSVLSAQGDRLSPKDVPLGADDETLAGVADARASAFRELKDALTGLGAEIMALDAAKQIADR